MIDNGNNEDQKIWVIVIAFLVSILYGFKAYDEVEAKTRGERIRKTLYGMGGSFITTFVLYEVFIYFGITHSLAAALGGAGGYLGAEFVKSIALRFLEKKIDRALDK